MAEPYALTIQKQGGPDITVEHRCTASIGVVLLPCLDASAEDILKKADMAMYRAKGGGRNQICFFESQAT